MRHFEATGAAEYGGDYSSTGSALPRGELGSTSCARCEAAVNASQTAARRPGGRGGKGPSMASMAGSRAQADHRAKQASPAEVKSVAARGQREAGEGEAARAGVQHRAEREAEHRERDEVVPRIGRGQPRERQRPG